MTKAQEIMKKKQFIKDEMDRQLTLKRSNFLWRKATKRLDSISGSIQRPPQRRTCAYGQPYFPVGSDLSDGERVYSR